MVYQIISTIYNMLFKMEHSFFSRILIITGFLFSQIGLAQTINQGELFIEPNTQVAIFDDFNNAESASFYNQGELFVYGDFNNDGVFDFLESYGGDAHFEGVRIQKITGSGKSYFHNILFNNNVDESYAFELSGHIGVANEANFFYGIVNNRDFGGQFGFESGATLLNVSENSYVNGSVYKQGDNAFVFPVGDEQSYRPASISAPDNSGDLFSVQYFYENPDVRFPIESKEENIESISTDEYWEVLRQSGKSEIVLTLSWDDARSSSNIIEEPFTDIHIVRWDQESNMWTDEGGVVSVLDRTVTTVAPVDGYGIFTLARVKAGGVTPTPGEVVIHNGITPNGDGVNDYFKIENLDKFPNNSVRIFNRWGVKVFETESYDTHGNVFRGVSEGRLTVGQNKTLPMGTYFYVLSYDDPSNGEVKRVRRAGYLYITSE